MAVIFMKKIKINGQKELSGIINISGAKNSVVALIPAAILTGEDVTLLNVPNLSDTENLKKILNLLGCEIDFQTNKLKISSKNLKNCVITEELSTKLRASYYFMGALLARFHHVEIYLPGGCQIGSRPMDLHFKGFEALGARVTNDGDKFTLTAQELLASDINLDFPSVGATVNIMLAASMAKGITTIENAAREPEIVNIADMINSMGGKIMGAGTNKITIEGVEKLHGTTFETLPDRIEAGTYMMIGALTGKDLTIKGLVREHLQSLITHMEDMGVDFTIGEESITLNKTSKLNPIDVTTEVYPGFPTDLGQPISVLLSQAEGTSHFKETIYESRTGHFPELVKMGANISLDGMDAKIKGVTKLIGKDVSATDLRAGAALIIAGLTAEGTTKISNIEYILRGYEDIVDKLKTVGADIEIIDE